MTFSPLAGEVPAKRGMGGDYRSRHVSAFTELCPPPTTTRFFKTLRPLPLVNGEKISFLMSLFRLSLSFRLSLKSKLNGNVRVGGQALVQTSK